MISNDVKDYTAINNKDLLTSLLCHFLDEKRDQTVVKQFKTKYGHLTITKEISNKVTIKAYPLTAPAFEALSNLNFFCEKTSPCIKINPLYPTVLEEYQFYNATLEVEFDKSFNNESFKALLVKKVKLYNEVHSGTQVYPVPKKDQVGYINAETGDYDLF